MNESTRQAIANRLTERIGRFECPICKKGLFTLSDGFYVHPIQNKIDGYLIGGNKQALCAVLVCTNCGYTSIHNLHSLDFSIQDIEVMEKNTIE